MIALSNTVNVTLEKGNWIHVQLCRVDFSPLFARIHISPEEMMMYVDIMKLPYASQ